jgi:nucleoside-diphosphate-sugar epimerase
VSGAAVPSAVPRVLITGCGDLGTEIGLRFAAAGATVFGLRRSPDVLPAPLVGIAGDLSIDAGLPTLPPDLDLVVHTPAGARGADAYRAVYHDGLQRVLTALADQRPRRLLFVSATSVYDVTDGSWVDEATPTEPARETGAVLLATEQLAAASPIPAVSLRLSGIYGPGRTRLIDQVRHGEAVQPDPPTHTNRIHRDDAAAAAVHLLTAVDDPAPVYLGTDDDPAEKGEVLRFLADELGLPHPPRGQVGPGRGGDKRCRNDLLRATGWAPRYPSFREGYRAILAGDGVRHR